ncbi:hypothetical protein [Flammeovirga sp. OC4]|uniref:hypothetical protein n=1 Tax=Flammeovirga sp. OC4 TaxID=1382345 RepID=UPI0005C45A98|nr:hypothetical protein [Flammeovirga sp. OC4]
MIIKKEKSELANYKSKGKILIPISPTEGIDIEHKQTQKTKKLKKWIAGIAYGIGCSELLYILYQFYSSGFQFDHYFNMIDLLELSIHTAELSIVPASFYLAHKLPQKDHWMKQYFYLDQEVLEIKMSFFKKYTFELQSIRSYEFKTNTYNQTYLHIYQINGEKTSIKWFQSFLPKEQKVVLDALFNELDKRINVTKNEA